MINVKDFPTAQDAIDSASSNEAIYFPAGVYTESIVYNKPNLTIYGDGPGVTVIDPPTTNVPGITVNPGFTKGMISNLSIERSTTPIAGGDGIRFEGTVDHFHVENIHFSGNYHNLEVKSTAWGIIRNIISEKAVKCGIRMVAKDHPVLQWKLDQILCQKNGAQGIIAGIWLPAFSDVAVGTWQNIDTFANAAPGISVVGHPSCAIHGIRILNSFIGQDAGAGVYLDTYGGEHSIENCYLELCGTGLVGPNVNLTPAPGAGILVTANNDHCKIVGNTIMNNSLEGVCWNANATLLLSSNRIVLNGQAGIAGRTQSLAVNAGILHDFGNIIV